VLVFKRYAEEAVIIGKGDSKVTVKVLWVGDNAVKLGISAPAHIQVDRDEVRLSKDESEKLLGGES